MLDSSPPKTPVSPAFDPASERPPVAPRDAGRRPSVRLWPAILILALQAACLFLTVTPSIDNQTRFLILMGAPAVCLLLFLGWLFGLSRIPWKVRLSLPLVVALCAVCVARWMDPSMGVPLWIYGLPAVLTGMTFGLWWAQRWNPWQQLGLAALLPLLAWAQLPWWKLDGFDGDYRPEFRWRWTASPEERLVPRSAVAQGAPAPPSALVVGPQDWPMFRGPAMNSRVGWSVGPLDWSTTPPRELWRQPIGPGWSSCAIVGDRLFTQEQRGEAELLTCLETRTGKLVWEVEQPVRFSDVVAGPGPRSTPTFDGGQVFAMGAKALITAHDAATGQLLWMRDLMKEVDAQLPVWGFSGSPLVVGDLVLIYAGGTDPHGLLAL
ncbi:MAG: PQQ-binding-like beta-propeller repeat protein, partial [Planctomycetaceae bacterium]